MSYISGRRVSEALKPALKSMIDAMNPNSRSRFLKICLIIILMFTLAASIFFTINTITSFDKANDYIAVDAVYLKNGYHQRIFSYTIDNVEYQNPLNENESKLKINMGDTITVYYLIEDQNIIITKNYRSEAVTFLVLSIIFNVALVFVVILYILEKRKKLFSKRYEKELQKNSQ